jgi:diaminopropionate ammonia-lyase
MTVLVKPHVPDSMTAQDRALLGPQAPDIVRRHLSLWQDILPTPLIPLPEITRSANVGSVMIKDEGQRLGLGSFKALGGAYAVMRIFHRKLQEHLGRTIPIDEIVSAAARSFARTVTFCCATDGNHGKSVAAGAKVLGCRSAIFVHQGVTEARASAIGSDLVVRVTGNYDDSVLEAKRVATEENWILVSDTSWPGYEDYPSIVAQGYTVLADEALAQYVEAGLAPPTHVFLQAGVGGFASSISAHLVERLGRPNIRTIVVEPDRAACLFESAIHGGLTSAPSTDPTIMAMLECYTPSLVGWRILQETADAFMTVTDDEAKAAMRALALRGGTPVISGESGAAGLAGLMSIAEDRSSREVIGLDRNSRVLLINTETATDPSSYNAIVGRYPEAVLTGCRN